MVRLSCKHHYFDTITEAHTLVFPDCLFIWDIYADAINLVSHKYQYFGTNTGAITSDLMLCSVIANAISLL